MTHTPAPWRMGADLMRVHPHWTDADGNSTPENLHRNSHAKTIAVVGKEDGDWRPIEQLVSDARLIAAAPDMLAAIDRYLAARKALESAPTHNSSAFDAAMVEHDAALADLAAASTKAKGEQP